MLGHAPLVRSDWWPTVEKLPQPRIAVIEDTDDPPGAGAVVGLAAVAVLRAMHCVAAVTNGAVRDVEAISRVQFPLFAGSLCPSHSYAHVLEFDHTVDVFGLVVAPGDLLMVDTHGVLSIPPDIVDQLPAAAEDMARRRREFVAFCESPQFSPERIAEEVQRLLL